jgi:long-chain fatty acid transport protein
MRSIYCFLVLSSALLGTLSVGSHELFAGGFSNPDMGGRRMGMFSVMGKPDDVTAIFHNPAGMILLDGTQFYHSQSWFIIELGMRMYDSEGVLHPAEREIEPDWNIGFLPFVGATTDFGTDRFRLGTAIYAPNAYGAKLPMDSPTRYHATEALFLAGRATLAAAYRLTDHFTLGASADLVYVHLMAKRTMNIKVLNDPDERFGNLDELAKTDSQLDISGRDLTYAWNIGLLFEPTDKLGIGMGFASGSPVNLEGPVTLTGPDGVKQSTDQHTTMTIPLTLRAGINWEFAPNFELGADVFYWHYQVLQEQRTELDEPLMGLNGFVDPKNYGNSWAWNVGMLYHVLPTVELMMGFQQDFTPIPTRTYTLDNPSRDQFGISLGTRWQVTKSVRLGLAMVRNWFELADVQDSMSTPPSNVKGHAANFEAAFDISWKL